MARETAAARRAREEAEENARQLEAAQNWLPRLMAAMELATGEFNFELTVKNEEFLLWDRDEQEQHALPLAYNPNRAWDLEAFENLLDRKNEELAEQRRVEMLRRSALAKLSAEERKVLGL